MAAVTIEPTGNPVFPWTISSPCQTWAEVMAKARELAAINPDAFIPVEHHALEAPMPAFLGEEVLPSIAPPDTPLPPNVAANIARHEDDDVPEVGLNFDKPRLVSQEDEE